MHEDLSGRQQRIAALIPVKRLRFSKSRLAPLLSTEQRSQLSFGMACDVIEAMLACRSISEVFVLTADESVAARAIARGCQVLPDFSGDGLNGNVRRAARHLHAIGYEHLLVVPGDVPSLNAWDIDQLIARHRGGVTLCPAEIDGGTNAMMCSPPNAIPYLFGEHSFAAHLEAALTFGVPAQTFHCAHWRDIDRPEDLWWLLEGSPGPHTTQVLARFRLQSLTRSRYGT